MSSIGGICGPSKYGIVEYSGLNSIQNAAHELGHKYRFSLNLSCKLFFYI